jgi:hypothetical protein
LLLLLLLTLVILGGAWFYTTWRSSQAVLPPGVTINGVTMGGMTAEQALTAIEAAYTLPISVTYASTEIPPLLPEMIELRVDLDATAENLNDAVSTSSTVRAFLTYILDELLRREPETIDVNAVVLYSRERVNAFLERVAQKYDHAPMNPVLLPEAGTFRPPRQGTELNIEASLPIVIEAILAAKPEERQVALVVETEPPPETSTEILEQALATTLAPFNGVAGIYAKDLTSGQELCIDCNVAFTGMSALKVGIALEIYRTHEIPLDAESAGQVNAMLTQGSDRAANALLGEIGAGNAVSGALRVTDFLWNLGLRSTYLAAPFDDASGDAPGDAAAAGAAAPSFRTPANARTDVTTAPDPARQTTPVEIGLLMEAAYQCSRGGGALRVLHPNALPPAECAEVLAWMERNQVNPLLAQGMPPGTRLAHKHGQQGGTHVDVALVYGPRTDIVLVAFLYEPAWQTWEESVPTFAQIGQLTYRFFNGD